MPAKAAKICIALCAVAAAVLLFTGGRIYYITAVLLLCGSFAGLAFWGERSRTGSAEMVLCALFCALAVAARAIFFYTPSLKGITAIVILAGIFMGARQGMTVGICSAFISNFLFGQGPWTPWQMLCWGLIGAVAGLCFFGKKRSRLTVCIFGALAVFALFASVMNPASILLIQPQADIPTLLASYIAGFPFDLIHSLSTALFLWLLYEPMQVKMQRLQRKFGLFEPSRSESE